MALKRGGVRGFAQLPDCGTKAQCGKKMITHREHCNDKKTCKLDT